MAHVAVTIKKLRYFLLGLNLNSRLESFFFLKSAMRLPALYSIPVTVTVAPIVGLFTEQLLDEVYFGPHSLMRSGRRAHAQGGET